MSEEAGWLAKFGPWIVSIIFGAGAGVAGARAGISQNSRGLMQQAAQIKVLEMWVKKEGMSREFHCVKCRAAMAEHALETERIVNNAVNGMAKELFAKIEQLHKKGGA